MLHQSIIDIPEILAKLGVQDAVISPGSRSAPLVLAFSRHPKITCYVIPDERSAGFVALGMSLKSKKPVVLICTSGSAVFNYAPAVAEAFYQEVPLIVLSADRPPEWIDQWDGQTIRQQNIFGNHVLRSYDFPVDLSHPDSQWFGQRIINEAYLTAMGNKKGPVHVNIPFREPFYPSKNEPFVYSDIRPFTVAESQHNAIQWPTNPSNFNKVLIVAGQQAYDERLYSIIEKLGDVAVVIADAQSNFSACNGVVKHHDLFLGAQLESSVLQPDLLITFGKSVISKNLKAYLRKHKAKNHWHISSYAPVPDTFQSLSHIISGDPVSILTNFLKGKSKSEESRVYRNLWRRLNDATAEILMENLGGTTSADFSEFDAIKVVLDELPEQVDVHVANSMPIRYVNFLGIQHQMQEVFVNRGTSGIDGSVSTAVGCALKSDRKTVLVTGDLAFFYDRNGLWHAHLPSNLIIVLLNNHGGGIFGMINGPKQQPELQQYFITQQLLTAENTAKDFGMLYLPVDNLGQLKDHLREAFHHAKTTLIEVVTKQEINEAKMQEIKESIKTI